MKYLESMECRLQYFKNEILNGRKLVMFGAGERSSAVVSTLRENGIEPYCICDNDISKWGKRVGGVKIVSPDEVEGKEIFYIASVVPYFYEEIKRQLGPMAQVYHMCTPFRIDDFFLNYKDVVQNDAYKNVLECFADDCSKKLFLKMLNYKITGNAEDLLNEIDGSSIFDDTLITRSKEHIYVDCGAFTGDTIMQFLLFSKGEYKNITAIEADGYNCECIERLVRYTRLDKIDIVNMGCWNEKAELVFYTYEGGEYENGDLSEKNKDSIASINKQSLENKKKIEKKLFVDKVDRLIDGKIPTIIKINTVSSDYQTLEGCIDTMYRFKPAIIIELGSRPDDILKIPNLIRKSNPEYKLFLRQKRVFLDIKTILYAV